LSFGDPSRRFGLQKLFLLAKVDGPGRALGTARSFFLLRSPRSPPRAPKNKFPVREAFLLNWAAFFGWYFSNFPGPLFLIFDRVRRPSPTNRNFVNFPRVPDVHRFPVETFLIWDFLATVVNSAVAQVDLAILHLWLLAF